jgi:hypothetical protein
MRLSNSLSSLDNEDLQTSNLPDALMRLEEANLEEGRGGEGEGRGTLSGSAKSSSNSDHLPPPPPHDRLTPSAMLTRLGSKVISRKSGGAVTSAPPVVNICLDINTNQVTEMDLPPLPSPTSPKSEFLGDTPAAPVAVRAASMMTKLKSAASVMQSSVMGFGFGLGVTETPVSSEQPDGAPRRSVRPFPSSPRLTIAAPVTLARASS